MSMRLHQQEFTKKLKPAHIQATRKSELHLSLESQELTDYRCILGAMFGSVTLDLTYSLMFGSFRLKSIVQRYHTYVQPAHWSRGFSEILQNDLDLYMHLLVHLSGY